VKIECAMEYWIERERELIRRHNDIIRRRRELLEETIKYTIDNRNVGMSDDEFGRLVDTDKFWFSKKVRNERLLKEVNETVQRVEQEALARDDTVTATRLRIQKEIYWNYINTQLPKWLDQVDPQFQQQLVKPGSAGSAGSTTGKSKQESVTASPSNRGKSANSKTSKNS